MVDVHSFVQSLQAFPPLTHVFNPWRDIDLENDASDKSPSIRAAQLQRYLAERIGRARVVLCATGKSTVQNANMIERGYERVEEKLLGLGARITRRA